MTETPDIDPSSTLYVVIRPETALGDSELIDIRDGEWRKRSDLGSENVIEILGPSGVVRAYPTDRIERSPADDLAQVYEVPNADDADATMPTSAMTEPAQRSAVSRPSPDRW